MPDPERGTYQAALDEARAAIAQARLTDPADHFPYKHADAVAAIDQDMSPDPSRGFDVTGADVMSPRIAEASQAFIAAQQALLEDPTLANEQAYQAAQDDLVAARRTHRRARVGPGGDRSTGGAVIGVPSVPLPPGQQGQPRARRVGEG